MHHNQPVPFKAVVIVFFAFVGASVVSHQSGFDHWLASQLYHWEGGADGGFPWRNSFWLSDVIHEKGRALVKRLFFLNLALLLLSVFVRQLRAHRLSFVFILVATLLSTGLISFLKHHTTIPCPEALVEFGGNRHWINIWQMFAPGLPRGSCYPAGHASGGYAWLCLAFLFPVASRQFYWALAPGALLGVCFGVSQQLRGAHFVSHDLLTIGLCWLISGALYHLMYNSKRVMLRTSERESCGVVVQNMS